jgi:hypothetical protein
MPEMLALLLFGVAQPIAFLTYGQYWRCIHA